MNPFYALNKTLDDIRNEPTQEQKALVESQAPKSPAKKTLEEALRSDLRSLMEDATGGMSGSNTLESSMPDYLYLSGKIEDLFIKLYDQGKIFNNEDFEKIKDRVASHLGYSLGDRIFEKAWLEATSEPNLDNDDSDYTDYSMRQGEMGRYDESKDKSLSKAAKTIKKGALHKQEGIPQDKKIGDKKLQSLKKSGTPLEKKRATFALNIQGKGKKKVNEWETDPAEEKAAMIEGNWDLVASSLESYGVNLPVPREEVPRLVTQLATNISYDLEGCPPNIVGEIIEQMNDQAIEDNSCSSCNGSGEGGYDGSRCSSCRGTGVKFNYDDMDEDYENVNELSHGTVAGYKSKAQSNLKKLKQQPVDDFVSNMRQGHRVGDAANMAVQNNLKAIKKAKTRGAGLDRANSRLDGEYASEGATPDQLDQQKISQMKRAAATRKNSRAVQQQPAQSGPRRSEVPSFIRKGRGDPGLDHTDLEETNMYSESDKDILDYLKAKLVPTGGNARAKSRPYNGSAGDADAYNGMEFEEAESKFDKREVSPGRTQYTRKYDPDTGHSIGADTGSSSASDGPRKRGRPAGSKSGSGNARHAGSHVSQAAMNSRKKDMDEDEYSRHTASKSPAGGTVYTRKYDPDTGHSIGTDTGSSAASDGSRKRGRPAGSKSGSGNARHAGSHVSQAAMNSRKKDMDEDSATCPHCGHAMADEGREVDMEGVKGGMGHFVKAAKKIGGVASAVKKAKKDYDGDGKIETGPEEHAGSVDKAIKANKAKSKAKPAAKPAAKSKAKSAEKTEEGNAFGKAVSDAKKDGIQKGEKVKVGGKEYPVKEEKVDETTTSGSVSTAPAKKSSGGSGVGKGIYDSWERKYESLLKEDVNVTTNSSKNDSGEEEEHITIDVSGDDVARIKEMLHSMGVSHGDEAGHEHGGEEECDSCGGVPCQCDEMDEAKQHDPDYEHDDDYDGNVDDVDDGPQNYYDSDERTRSDQFEDGMEEGSYSAKAAHAGKDIGKPGKNFAKIAKGAAEKYGSKAAGERVAGAVLNKLRHPSEDVEESDMDEETSFKDAGATIGRIGGTIAGGLGGAAAGLGIGTVPGAVAGGIAGGSAGSALGTAAGRWLDKKTGAPEETDEDMSGHQRMMELAGLGEANVAYSDNEPDYPSNQEYSNDEMQYSGGLNGKKSTGQATVPVVASQVNRLQSHVSEGQRMSDLYKAIQAIENKEV